MKTMMKNIYHKLWNVYLAIRRKPYVKEIMKYIAKDTSVISSNCFAGRIMQDFGMQYNSPTLGLWVLPSDFANFCSNLSKYLTSEIKETCVSKTELGNYKMKNAKHRYPVGLLGGEIELHFLHYPTIEEAVSKWKRRAERVNLDNYILIGSEQNGCTEEDVKNFDKIPYDKKLFFTSKPYPYKCVVYIPEFSSLGYVGDPYKKSYIYYKYLLKWLKNKMEVA